MAFTTLVWFRSDLRLSDNQALSWAAARGAVVPVFVWAPEEEQPWSPGAASRWWLHHSLERLSEDLRGRGSRLVLRTGPSIEALVAVARETNAKAVAWVGGSSPGAVVRDARVRAELTGTGLQVEVGGGDLLFEPEEVATRKGTGYQVFTPFWRAALRAGAPHVPWAAPARLAAPVQWPASLRLGELGLLPRIDWAEGLRAAWVPGEGGAQARLKHFLDAGLHAYPDRRDRPDLDGTSRLSPHLHFGEISPRQVWDAVRVATARHRAMGWVAAGETFLRQLGWREFGHHLLRASPHLPERSLHPRFEHLRWRRDSAGTEAWRQGRTGYPIVDAGMRELWATGFMHNRVRMIAASFLVKDLLVDWRVGARWFWDTLVDADLANNTLGWQWVAGSGPDASPFVRVFNPVLQGTRFDPQGTYVRRWVPELARLPDRYVHEPWTAPSAVLAGADVSLGGSYPRPIVDHRTARLRALAVYARVSRL